MNRKQFPHHIAMYKHHSRLLTTNLLLSLLNTGYYTSSTLLHGQNFELDNRQIKDRIFLKTIIRE